MFFILQYYNPISIGRHFHIMSNYDIRLKLCQNHEPQTFVVVYTLNFIEALDQYVATFHYIVVTRTKFTDRTHFLIEF